jgi:hypothetical protein
MRVHTEVPNQFSYAVRAFARLAPRGETTLLRAENSVYRD